MKIKMAILTGSMLLPGVALWMPLAAAAQPDVAPPTQPKTLPAAEEAMVKKAFEEGNAFMEARKYAQALAAYQRALAKAPDEPSLLWNGGLSAYLSGDYAAALPLWKRLKQQEPRDGAVRTKLIQTYQALNKRPEREAERAELFALRADARKRNPNSEALKQKDYCRDQFEASGRSVFAYEFFEMEGPRARRYKFIVLKKDGDSEDFNISLGSYPATNDYMRESGKLKPGQRVFHLDGYYAEGLHKTFGFFEREPSYDQTRALVEEILAGKRRELSSRQKDQINIGPK